MLYNSNIIARNHHTHNVCNVFNIQVLSEQADYVGQHHRSEHDHAPQQDSQVRHVYSIV